MINVLNQILNTFSGYWENFTTALSQFTGAFDTFTSMPGILPELWLLLPSQIRTFLIACIIMLFYVIVLRKLIRKE